MKPKSTSRVYGLSAALACWRYHPESVISIAHTEAVRHELSELLRAAAKRRTAYREVSDEELSRMAESVHHEGVCLLVRQAPTPEPSELAARLGEHALVVALDGVENPHNVGAVVRSAAFFGLPQLLLADRSQTQLTAAARRVAEGGAELVDVAYVASLPDALRALGDQGFELFGSDARAKLELSTVRWPKRSVIVLGHERDGLSKPVREACKALVKIAGNPQIDSLNVSVAAGIFMASYRAVHPLEASAPVSTSTSTPDGKSARTRGPT